MCLRLRNGVKAHFTPVNIMHQPVVNFEALMIIWEKTPGDDDASPKIVENGEYISRYFKEVKYFMLLRLYASSLKPEIYSTKYLFEAASPVALSHWWCLKHFTTKAMMVCFLICRRCALASLPLSRNIIWIDAYCDFWWNDMGAMLGAWLSLIIMLRWYMIMPNRLIDDTIINIKMLSRNVATERSFTVA